MVPSGPAVNRKSARKPPRGASRPVKKPVAPRATKEDRGTGDREVDPSGTSSPPQVPPPATSGKAMWEGKGKWKDGIRRPECRWFW